MKNLGTLKCNFEENKPKGVLEFEDIYGGLSKGVLSDDGRITLRPVNQFILNLPEPPPRQVEDTLLQTRDHS